MITYELAKQLKDVGFPQEMKGGDRCFWAEKIYVHTGGGHLDQNNRKEGFYFQEGATCCFDDEDYTGAMNIYDDAVVKIPTLSELIAECGDVVLWKYRNVWYAGNGKGKEMGTDYVDDYWYENEKEKGSGEEPEEAVSRLYINSK
jgi:hypothetical protein